jgi:hypothetical protein
MAEDGELESQRFHARPPSKRCQHPGWFILQERKAQHSKLTVLPAHRLAGEPGAPVRFTFRTLPGIRTRTSSS